MTGQSVKVAVVQRPPVLLNRDSTLKAAVDAMSEVADAGAGLVVFPETYLPGYPVWIWSLRPADDYQLSQDIHAQLLANSID
jgi:nitrilase